MHRGALKFCVFLLTWAPCVQAFAHGVPPDAYSVLTHDATGALAVSLSAGVALRRSAQSYQFVCPMAWGDQFSAPVAALADGTIVVAATRGLMLLSADGTLSAHPDPAAVGRSSDLVRSARGVFALRTTPQGSEVLAVDAQTVRVLWKDTNSLYSLAALDDKLVLLRANGLMLQQVTIASADGTELERQTAPLESPVDNVYARANAGAAYALVVFRNGTIAIGSLQANVFSKLGEGELSIAGPLSVDNVTLLALDGKLEQVVEGRATPLADAHNVVCLAEHDGLSYACETNGIARVTGSAVGAPLFRFGWLTAPDLARVPEGDDRFYCNTQWADLRLDMQLLMPDVGGAAADASIAGAAGVMQLPAAPAAGGVSGQPAGGAPAVLPPQPTQTGGTSCAILPGRAPRAAEACALALALALTVLRCRRARKR
jgi:hypothetical protein